jgi:hypothetical protein
MGYFSRKGARLAKQGKAGKERKEKNHGSCPRNFLCGKYFYLIREICVIRC